MDFADRLRLRDKTPIDWVGIIRVCPNIECRACRYGTDISDGFLIVTSSFNDSDAQGCVLSETGCDSQTGSSTADDDVVKSGIRIWPTVCVGADRYAAIRDRCLSTMEFSREAYGDANAGEEERGQHLELATIVVTWTT